MKPTFQFGLLDEDYFNIWFNLLCPVCNEDIFEEYETVPLSFDIERGNFLLEDICCANCKNTFNIKMDLALKLNSNIIIIKKDDMDQFKTDSITKDSCQNESYIEEEEDVDDLEEENTALINPFQRFLFNRELFNLYEHSSEHNFDVEASIESSSDYESIMILYFYIKFNNEINGLHNFLSVIEKKIERLVPRHLFDYYNSIKYKKHYFDIKKIKSYLKKETKPSEEHAILCLEQMAIFYNDFQRYGHPIGMHELMINKAIRHFINAVYLSNNKELVMDGIFEACKQYKKEIIEYFK